MDDKTWQLVQKYPVLYVTHYHIDKNGDWVMRNKGLSWLHCPPERDSFFDHVSYIGSLAVVTRCMKESAKRGYFGVTRYY